jgi:hypothetical protein
VLIPLKVILFGKVSKIGLAINSASSAEVRGKGLFTTLAKLSFAAAKEEDCEAVIAICNANSTPTYINKLDSDLVCPLEARVCFGTPIRNKNFTSSTKDLEVLYDVYSARWRLNHPSHDYYVSKNSADFLVHKSFKVVEILMTCNESVTAHQPLRETKLKLPKIWIGKSNIVSWGKVLNFNLPRRFRPSPLNLLFKDLTEKRKLDPENLHFECFNFDAY